MIKKFVVLLISFILVISPASAFLRGGYGIFQPPSSFTATWQPFRLGGGGQLTAVYNYPDNTTLIRGDAYGGWILERTNPCVYGGTSYAAPCWRNVVTASSIPSYNIDTNFGEGVVELVAAPSNTDVLYMLWGTVASATNNLWVSTDRGVHWTLIPSTTGFPGSTQQANNGNAMGPYIAVDPNNPDIVFVDTLSHGVYRSTNARSGASSTWTQVSGVGTTTAHVIAFEPGSSTHVVIVTKGTAGAFESTNGTTFSAITAGSPPGSGLTALHTTIDKFGQIWVWDSGGGTGLWRWASNTWTSISTSSTRQVAAFSPDPNSASLGANHIMVSDYYGQLNLSTNNGSTWTGNNTNETFSAGSSQPTWIGNANQGAPGNVLLNGYSMTFDQSSNVLFAGGIGAWQANAPITAPQTSLNWNASALGIEELIDVAIMHPPGGWPLTIVWDRGGYTILNPDVFPTANWNNSTSNPILMNGFGLDYAFGTPNFVVNYIPTTNMSGYSIDGGQTWTSWNGPSWTGIDGGALAVSTTQNWILTPSPGSQLYYTTNQGTTWTASTIAGSPTNWLQKGVGYPLAADRVNANNFCAVNGATFYYSTNSGQNFASTSATIDGSAGQFAFRSVPGKGFTYLYTAGQQSGASHPANTHLWRLTKTTNPCDTATIVNSNLKEVMGFGFGAMPPGNSSYTTAIYANGWYNGVQGIYVSLDGGTTWAAINVPASQIPWPLNNADFPMSVEGDPDVYGRIYIPFQASAGGYIDTQDACPSVKFTSAIKPNDTITGTVNLVGQSSGLPAATITAVNFYVDGALIGTQTSGVSAGVPNAPNVKNYTQSWNTGSVAHGAHTIKVEAVGNGCTAGGGGNAQSIPITTSSLEPANDNTHIWLEKIA